MEEKWKEFKGDILQIDSHIWGTMKLFNMEINLWNEWCNEEIRRVINEKWRRFFR